MDESPMCWLLRVNPDLFMIVELQVFIVIVHIANQILERCWFVILSLFGKAVNTERNF